jgi:hypothetical protein
VRAGGGGRGAIPADRGQRRSRHGGDGFTKAEGAALPKNIQSARLLFLQFFRLYLAPTLFSHRRFKSGTIQWDCRNTGGLRQGKSQRKPRRHDPRGQCQQARHESLAAMAEPIALGCLPLHSMQRARFSSRIPMGNQVFFFRFEQAPRVGRAAIHHYQQSSSQLRCRGALPICGKASVALSMKGCLKPGGFRY